METAFSLLYVSKDFPEIYAKGAGRRRKAGTRTEIEDFLRLTFGVLTEIGLKAPVENLYSSLTRHLESSDTVVTLNYDTVLDTALMRSGWPPGKGYCVIGGRNKLSGSIANAGACERLSGVKLLKLHGSLNWFVRGSDAELAHVFESKPNQIVIGETRRRERTGLIRQIIPPIYGKFFKHSHWQTLWEHAYEAILKAEAIVIIGCSLVDTDFHLTGMLGHAIGARSRLGHDFSYEILVDNTKTRRKWHRLLGRSVRTRVDFANFAKFVSALNRNREEGM
ncbi:MAG: SIR2 family protein [Candidatus Acidiferrales bacterium]